MSTRPLTASPSPQATAQPSRPISSQLVRHSLKIRKLEVLEVSRPTPRLCRVLLGGAELAGFVSLAPDDHVKVLFPQHGHREPKVPEVLDGRVLWPNDAERPIARDYTPVHYDPTAGVLELHIVLHGPGHASNWAQHAKAGYMLAVAGPRGSHVMEEAPRTLLLVGVETALPAITRWLKELPEHCQVTAIIEIGDANEERALESRSQAVVRWVLRDETPGRALLAAVERAELPEGLEHAWLAGEAAAVRAVREHLLNERHLVAERISARGYWKLGVRDHQEPHDD